MATKAANKATVGSKVYSNFNQEVDGNEVKDMINLAIDESVNQDEYDANELLRASQIQALDEKFLDYIPSSEKGEANGVAELDEDGKLPISQLPSSVGDHDSLDGIKGTGTYHISQGLAEKLGVVNPYSFLANNSNVGGEAALIQSYAWFFTLLSKSTLSEGKNYLGIETTAIAPQTLNVNTEGTSNLSFTSKYNKLKVQVSNPSAGIRRINLQTSNIPEANIIYLDVDISENSYSGFQVQIYSSDAATNPLISLRANSTGELTRYSAVIVKDVISEWRIFGEYTTQIRGIDNLPNQIAPRLVFQRFAPAFGASKQQCNLPVGCKIKNITIYPGSGNYIIESASVGYSDGGAEIEPLTLNPGNSFGEISFDNSIIWTGGSLWVNYQFSYIDPPAGQDKANIVIEYIENYIL